MVHAINLVGEVYDDVEEKKLKMKKKIVSRFEIFLNSSFLFAKKYIDEN